MERAIEIYVMINCAIIGLSHAAAPQAWTAFFTRVRERAEPGVLAIGLLQLSFGSLIVALHNVWSGLPMLVTLYGWANVLKAFVYLTFPSFGLGRMRVARSRDFVLAGVAMLAFAALLAYIVVPRS